MTLLINQALYSFEMSKYASFAEINMIYTTITKAQLLPFDALNMRYPSSKFCNPYFLKKFAVIKALFFLLKKFCLSRAFFFLWFFNPYDYRNELQLVLFSN